MGISTGMLFLHPTIIVHLLDTLQMIRYIIYLQIDYPILVIKYFEFFDAFDFSFLPNITPNNKFYTDSPGGF